MDNPPWAADDDVADFDMDTDLPEPVAAYLVELYNAMVNNEVSAVRYLYYRDWKDLTRSYYAETEWPSVDQVAPLCDENEVFLLCYQELCFRHVFMNGQPSLINRLHSWENYRKLFDTFLDGASTSKLLLPLEWLNDMIDEFLYQWMEFTNYKHIQGKEATEIELLRENPNMWKVQTVLGYLTSFVERSQIARDLAAPSTQHAIQRGVSSQYQQQQQQQQQQYSILKALGAFSLVGLCRAQCLLADYRYAIRVLDPVDIDDQRAIFTQITPCSLTLFYNLGFAYLMSRRYADALQVFSRVLISRRSSIAMLSKSASKEEAQTSHSFAEDQITNKYDKILALAALSSALSPGLRVDEQVRKLIQEKFEKLSNAQNARTVTDETVAIFEELFAFACPKFLNPATPSYLLNTEAAPMPADASNSKEADPRKELYRVQLKWFLEDVRQQLSLPTIRSFLKLYKSIPVDKLSRFCQMEMDQFRQNLIFIKARSSQVVRGVSDGSSPMDGVRTSISDVHFYVVGDRNPSEDMVHIVTDVSSRQQYNGKLFAMNALKFQTVIDDLQREEIPTQEDPMDYPEDDEGYGN